MNTKEVKDASGLESDIGSMLNRNFVAASGGVRPMPEAVLVSAGPGGGRPYVSPPSVADLQQSLSDRAQRLWLDAQALANDWQDFANEIAVKIGKR